MNDGLQARGWVQIVSGGYDGEDRGVSSGISSSYQPISNEGEREITYFYRDSQIGNNSSSTRVEVTLKERWSYTKESNNRFNITVEAWLTEIKRTDKQGNITCCSSTNPSRTIQVYNHNGTIVWGPKETNTAQPETIMTGNVYLGKRTYLLEPQKETPINELSGDYLNYTTGYWAGNVPSEYADQLRFGIQFFNGLPDECDPPQLIGVTQTDDICENTVRACMTFAPCSCEGMALHLEWRYRGQSWSSDRSTDLSASAVDPIEICLEPLLPTNHTWDPVMLEWRAKFVPVFTTMQETKWTEDSFQMMFILHPHETVPDINPQECSQLGRGDLIPKYTSETCYNEFSCADQSVNVNGSSADVENCKKVNGVSK